MNNAFGPNVHLKVNVHLKLGLSASLPLRGQIRPRDQAEEHAGGWLSVVPNDNLGSCLTKGEYQLLSEFLGLPLLPDSAPGHTATIEGNPWMFSEICRHSGLWKRHNFPRDALADITTSSSIRRRTDERVQGKLRPAGLLVCEWDAAWRLILLFVTHWQFPVRGTPIIASSPS